MAYSKATDYYRFDRDLVFPSFPQLLQDCPATEEVVYGPQVETTDWVLSALSGTKRVCERFAFKVLLADLSIIQDQRLLNGQHPYLVNHVACYREFEDAAVSSAYKKAMLFMKSKQAGEDPLVPHPWFYEYLYLATPVREHAQFSHHTQVEPCSPTTQIAFRQRYPYEPGPGKQPVEEQLGRLLRAFLENLPCNAAGLFERSVLFAVPFHRSPFQPVLSGTPEHGDFPESIWKLATSHDPSPGGALFLFVEPLQSSSADVEKCAVSLQRMMTRATLAESSSQLGTQLTFNNLLSSIVHGGVNAIRAIGSGDLCRAVSEAVPPTSIEDLYPVFRQDARTANDLILALNQALMGEDTAAALLSFVEMNLDRGVFRRKFQNPEATKLHQLLIDSELMVNGIASRSQASQFGYAPVGLTVHEIGPTSDHNGGWCIPEGYLDAKIIRGLLLEIVRNAAMYGARSSDGTVTLRCDVRPHVRGGVVCCFRNEATKRTDMVGGFLLRMSRVLARLRGLELTFQPDELSGTFNVDLWLGPLSIERQSSKNVYEVSPSWQVPAS